MSFKYEFAKYIRDPGSCPGLLFHDDNALIIRDLYPKSLVHFLVIPTEKTLERPQQAFADDEFRKKMDKYVDKAREMVVSSWPAHYAVPGGQIADYIQVCCHSIPSMANLHIHVMTKDLCIIARYLAPPPNMYLYTSTPGGSGLSDPWSGVSSSNENSPSSSSDSLRYSAATWSSLARRSRETSVMLLSIHSATSGRCFFRSRVVRRPSNCVVSNSVLGYTLVCLRTSLLRSIVRLKDVSCDRITLYWFWRFDQFGSVALAAMLSSSLRRECVSCVSRGRSCSKFCTGTSSKLRDMTKLKEIFDFMAKKQSKLEQLIERYGRRANLERRIRNLDARTNKTISDRKHIEKLRADLSYWQAQETKDEREERPKRDIKLFKNSLYYDEELNPAGITPSGGLEQKGGPRVPGNVQLEYPLPQEERPRFWRIHQVGAYEAGEKRTQLVPTVLRR
ncbi:hypothetical protein KL947_002550 [Ogataea haglerorum]|nr:hypothetical protein KL947_002550 [Ogataea haglerorum]